MSLEKRPLLETSAMLPVSETGLCQCCWWVRLACVVGEASPDGDHVNVVGE